MDTRSLHQFFRQVTRLKLLPRAGWQRCGLNPCESVAEHTFGLALLAFSLPKLAASNINRERCLALALVHDLAESIVGDLTPHDGVDPAEKHRREEQAMRQLAAMLGDEEILQLWQEFEAAQTPEARLVRELDVIEMAWQARTYQESGRLTIEQAEGFISSAQARVSSPLARQLLGSGQE